MSPAMNESGGYADAAVCAVDEQGADAHTVKTFAEVVDDAVTGIRRSVYKRLQRPPIVIASERAFGFDLRETIINEWKG
jgi:hypothetical protein